MIRDLLSWVCNEEGKKVADELLEAISKACNGSPRQALISLDQVIDIGDPKKALEIITHSAVGRPKGTNADDLAEKIDRPVMRGRGKGRDFGKMTDKQFAQMGATGKKGSQADELVALGEDLVLFHDQSCEGFAFLKGRTFAFAQKESGNILLNVCGRNIKKLLQLGHYIRR